MYPDNKQLCNCGHDLELHDARGCMADNSNGRQCSCSRWPNGVLALFAPPEPRPVSRQPVSEPAVDAILSKFWTVQKYHQTEHEEQMRILGRRRSQPGRKIS